jgi:hypothetical protein
MKYRKKPIVVEAERWFPGKTIEGVQPFGDEDPRIDRLMMEALPLGADPANYGWIETLEGGHIVSSGDWIITGIAGEKYPCKDAIFQATYEPVDLSVTCCVVCGAEAAADNRMLCKDPVCSMTLVRAIRLFEALKNPKS